MAIPVTQEIGRVLEGWFHRLSSAVQMNSFLVGGKAVFVYPGITVLTVIVHNYFGKLRIVLQVLFQVVTEVVIVVATVQGFA